MASGAWGELCCRDGERAGGGGGVAWGEGR